MSVSENLIRKYAELIVRTGANVQPGQVVSLTVAVEQHEFAALITEECYKAGAKKVNVDWTSDVQNRLNFLYAEQDVLAAVLPWQEEKLKQMVEDLPCRIFIVSDDPDALNGIDPAKISFVSQSRGKVIKPYRNAIDGKHQWVIAAHPSEKWAKKCFPDAEDAMDRLWDAVLKTVRVRDDNDRLPLELERFSIGEGAIEQIRELLKKEDKIFTLQEDDIEEHPDYFVLDGYHQQFTFGLEGKENTICCSNIQILEGEYDKCPNGAYLINVFRKIEKILKKAGVDKKYLRLTME